MKGLNPREQQNLEADLKLIFATTTVGGVVWQNVVLAQHRAREWASTAPPASSEERGGSSSPVELAERVEDRKVGSQAVKDLIVFDRLLPGFHAELVIAFHSGGPTRELARVAQELAALVSRYTRTVDHGLLPKDVTPGCRSCARLGRTKTKPGHFEPLSEQERFAKKGLCTWCGRHTVRGVLPLLDAVDIRVRQGDHAAGRWLARNEKRKGAA